MTLWLVLLLGATDPASDEVRDNATEAYYVCIRDKSITYARGKESAEAIAGAVTSACADLERPWHDATIAWFAARGTGGARTEQLIQDQLLPELHASAHREALRWVIEARLPPPSRPRNKTH